MSLREDIEALAVEHGWFVEGIGKPITSTRDFTYVKGQRRIQVAWTPTGRLSDWRSNSILPGSSGWGGKGGRGRLIAYIVQPPREDARERVAAWVHEHTSRGKGNEQLDISYEHAPLLLSDIKALLEN